MYNDDMYSIIEFIKERQLEAHKNAAKCEHQGYQLGEERYRSQVYAYSVVLAKLMSMGIDQRPHIPRDIDYVL